MPGAGLHRYELSGGSAHYKTVFASGEEPLAVGSIERRGAAPVRLHSPLLRKVGSIQALNAQSITLLLTRSRVVQWGTSARSRQKGRVLQALLNLHHSRYASTFDVSDPDQPFTH